MPSDRPPANEVDRVQQQIESLARECAALSAAHGRARQLRLLLTLALIVFVAIVCFAFYRLGSRIMSKEYADQLATTAETRLEKNKSNYMRHVELLVDKTSPALSQAFTDQVNKDMPTFLKLAEQERDLFAKDLEGRVGDRLRQRYEDRLDSHEKILKTEFPMSDNPAVHARMMKNLKIAVDRLLEKHYIAEYQRQLDQLFVTWDRFPPASNPGKNEPSLEEQFKGELIRLLVIKLGSTQPAGRP